MDITINGQAADITMETEQTVGEVLSGIETWLQDSGYRLSALRVNGRFIDSASIAEAFGQNLLGVESIAIETSSWVDLALEALIEARSYLNRSAEASAEEQALLLSAWESSAAASFLGEQEPDIFTCTGRALKAEGAAPEEAGTIIDERIRELEDPSAELQKMEGLVEEIVRRLEDLPLDIQTGKDGRAAETVAVFSSIAEKVFRLLYLLKGRGADLDSIIIDSLSMPEFMGEFSAALKELLAAYEAKDVVLVGDLAEYELAPRLLKWYSALKSPVLR